MIKQIEHNGNKYPYWQAEGNAAKWIMPLALEVLGNDKHGLDIGCNRIEWAYTGNCVMVDPEISPEWHAMNLPDSGWDYIFSSHCLEHVKENWSVVLDYWLSKLRDGGVLFLYLPHKSQTYWHPTSNRKHIHSFDGSEIADYLRSLGYEPYLTPVDYNNSFAVICYKDATASKINELKKECKACNKVLSVDAAKPLSQTTPVRMQTTPTNITK